MSLAKLELTKRQREILTLAAGGLGDREIADRLKISPHTVNSHFRIIFAKAGVRCRRAVCVRLALQDPKQLSLALG